jgi:hypothetical protein
MALLFLTYIGVAFSPLRHRRFLATRFMVHSILARRLGLCFPFFVIASSLLPLLPDCSLLVVASRSLRAVACSAVFVCYRLAVFSPLFLSSFMIFF